MEPKHSEETKAAGTVSVSTAGHRFTSDGFDRFLTETGPKLIWAYGLIWIFAAFVIVEILGVTGMRFDNYEMLLMGHEWQPVYWKHPAGPPWIAEAYYILTGRSVLAMYALPIVFVMASLWLTIRLCRPILGAAGTTVAIVLSLSSWYVMTPILQFNHNVAQFPFWVLAVLCYRRATTKPAYLNWILLGAVAAFLLQTKYTGALLLATLLAHMLWFPQTRRLILRPQPWVSLLVMLALLSPTLHYLVHHGSSLSYAVQRPRYDSLLENIVGPFWLVLEQIVFHIALIILIVIAMPWGRRGADRPVPAIALPDRTVFDRSLLIAATAGPLALSALFYAFAGVWGRAEALGSMFMLVGPSVVACLGQSLKIARPRLAMAFFAVVLAGPALVTLIDTARRPYSGHRLPVVMIPYGQAARDLDADWRKTTGKPLDILAGDLSTAGGLAAFHKDRPSVLIDGRMDLSPWITDKRIAAQGVQIVWYIADTRHPGLPAELAAPLAHYKIEPMAPLRIETKWDRYAPRVLIGRAVIRPRS